MGSDDNTHDETTTSDALASDRRHFLRNAAIAGASGASILTGASAAEAKPRIKGRRSKKNSCDTELARRAGVGGQLDQATLQPSATRCVMGYSRIRNTNLGVKNAAYRTFHDATTTMSDLVLVYSNSVVTSGTNSSGAAGPQMAPHPEAIVVKAVVELQRWEESSDGKKTLVTHLWPATFGLPALPAPQTPRSSRTIQPGGLVYSDNVLPANFTIAAGERFWVRTYVESTSGGWPLGISLPLYPVLTDPLQGIQEPALDWHNTASFGPVTSGTKGYSPAAILSKPPAPTEGVPVYRSVALIGDSIINGTGEDVRTTTQQIAQRSADVTELGFAVRALSQLNSDNAGQWGHLKLSVPGGMIDSLVDSGADGVGTLPLASHCRYALVCVGRNDLTAKVLQPAASNWTALRIAGNLYKLWTMLRWSGLEVFQTTITPRTLVSGTTPEAGDGTNDMRNQLNAWLRARAPWDPTTRKPFDPATLTGPLPARAVLAGDSSDAHPLKLVIDTAATVEAIGSNGVPDGKWNIGSDLIFPSSTTSTGAVTQGSRTHPNSLGHSLMSAEVWNQFWAYFNLS